MEALFGLLWLPASYYAARWKPDGDNVEGAFGLDELKDACEYDETDLIVREPLLALLFYIYSSLDVNEFGIDFLRCTYIEKKEYVRVLYQAVERAAIELD